MRASAALVAFFSLQLLVLAGACGGSSGTGLDPSGSGRDGGGSGNPGTNPGSSPSSNDAGPGFTGKNNDDDDAGSSKPPRKGYVYVNSPGALFRLDPVASTAAEVGPFTGFASGDMTQQVIDIAIDANYNGFATTFMGVYKLDIDTAKLTLVRQGTYPNSLSFVPKGTLDPNVEALVGYNGAKYVRIDTATGNLTEVGSGLSNGYESSGDIVSVTGGGTFLTVAGNECGDCLFQIDPKTGAMIQNYGSVNHKDVFGLAFWGGTAYGADNGGEFFSISWQNGGIVTTNIPVPVAQGVQFWGAGSTTSAPAMAADGGGIPLK